MEELLEQERSMTSDDIKPSSSSTTTKSNRSNKQTSNGTKTRRHKRRRPTNSARSSSDHSSSSSRSSSTSSSHSSSHSSIKPCLLNEQELKKTRSILAQEHLQTIIEKTSTGHYDILDSFAFLSFETDDDWRIAFEHFRQQKTHKALTTKKSLHSSGRKNGHSIEHSDGHSLSRPVSVPCKIEDAQRIPSVPISAAVDDVLADTYVDESIKLS
jgi:hypothetical protein